MRRLTVQTFMVTDGFLFKQHYYHGDSCSLGSFVAPLKQKDLTEGGPFISSSIQS